MRVHLSQDDAHTTLSELRRDNRQFAGSVLYKTSRIFGQLRVITISHGGGYSDLPKSICECEAAIETMRGVVASISPRMVAR